MAEHIMTPVEFAGKLVVRIVEVFEAVLPQAHILEAAERLFVRLDPVRRAERNQQNQAADVRGDSAENKITCKRKMRSFD